MLLRLQNLQLRVSVQSLESGLPLLVGVPLPGSVRCGEELQLLHLQSFAEVAQWRPLYSESAYQLLCEQLERKLLKNLTMFIQHVMGL